MSVKIQLLALEELVSGNLYFRRFREGCFSDHPDTKAGWSKTHIKGEFYFPVDAIEFVKPDPDKGLIEGWVESLPRDGMYRDLDSDFQLKDCGLELIARSFLAYQRKQEGKQ